VVGVLKSIPGCPVRCPVDRFNTLVLDPNCAEAVMQHGGWRAICILVRLPDTLFSVPQFRIAALQLRKIMYMEKL